MVGLEHDARRARGPSAPATALLMPRTGAGPATRPPGDDHDDRRDVRPS